MPKILKRFGPSLALAVIILFHIINTFIWLKIDKSYLKLDAWGHYRYSLEVFEFLKGLFRGAPLASIEPMKWHGFLVGFTTAPLYFIFGQAQDTAVMISSVIFLTIAVLATYGIAKKLLNKQAGLLAAFILTVYPLFFNNLRIYMLDLALTGMVALSLYLLIACDNFSNTKKSLLLGLSLGLGFLVKFNYAAFIIGPLMLTAYRAFIKRTGPFRDARRNFLYLTALTMLLILGFYLARATDMLNRITQASYLDMLKGRDFSHLASLKTSWLLKYAEIFIGEGMSFFLFLAFIAGLIFFIRLKLRNRWIIYLAALIPLFIQILFFLIPPECMVRYCLPLLPMTAIISAVGISSIKNPNFKKIIIALLIPLSLVQFFAVSYGLPQLPDKIIIAWRHKSGDFNIILFRQDMAVPPFLHDKTSHPSSADWKSSRVLNAIRRTNTAGERIRVVSLSNIPEIFEAMEYQIFINRELIDLVPASSITAEGFYESRTIPLDKICLTANYIIISDNAGSAWEDIFSQDRLWRTKIERARDAFHGNIANYKLIGVERLPDQSLLSIYKNIAPGISRGSCEIRNSDIRFLFDNGRGRIFYKNTEITKGLGLYTSLFSLQHWRDSMEAGWDVKKLSATKIIAEGRWMFIPVSQVWKIELKNNNIINWQVEIRAQDTIKIEAEDFKLMLRDEYKEWFITDGEHGVFPDYFEKNLWQKLWVGGIDNQPGTGAVRLKGAYLPKVKFRVYRNPDRSLSSVENSDQLFDGRVIGCFKNNPAPENLFPAGSYQYFSAEITVE